MSLRAIVLNFSCDVCQVLYLRLPYNFILHKPMEFTNIRVDVLAMYFQVIKVEHVGLHMDYMVSRGRRVSLFIFSALVYRLILHGLVGKTCCTLLGPMLCKL